MFSFFDNYYYLWHRLLGQSILSRIIAFCLVKAQFFKWEGTLTHVFC